MNENEFILKLKDHDINLSDDQIKQLNTYYELIIEYNSHTNITAITEKNDIYLKHFYDSITPTFYYKFNNQTLLDIGTGAGLPGIVLKIIYPNLKVYLLDSNNKKTTFLKMVVDKLNLNNVVIINDRSEVYIKEKREYFDIVIARAVKDMSILSELAIPFVKINGVFIAMKGLYSEEIANSQNYISQLGGNIISINKLCLTNNKDDRTIIIINKERKTDIIFPREYSKIVKKPLK